MVAILKSYQLGQHTEQEVSLWHLDINVLYFVVVCSPAPHGPLCLFLQLAPVFLQLVLVCTLLSHVCCCLSHFPHPLRALPPLLDPFSS